MPQVEDTRGKLSELDIQRQKLAGDSAQSLFGCGRKPQEVDELSLRASASQDPINRPDVVVVYVSWQQVAETYRIPIVIQDLADGIHNLSRSFISGICHVPMRRRASPSFDIQLQELARDCAKLLVGHGRPPQKGNELSLRTAASQNPIDRPDVAVIFVFRHSEADRIPIVIENLTDGTPESLPLFYIWDLPCAYETPIFPFCQIERNIGPII